MHRNGPKKVLKFFGITDATPLPRLVLVVGAHARIALDAVVHGRVSLGALRAALSKYCAGGLGALRLFVEAEEPSAAAVRVATWRPVLQHVALRCDIFDKRGSMLCTA